MIVVPVDSVLLVSINNFLAWPGCLAKHAADGEEIKPNTRLCSFTPLETFAKIVTDVHIKILEPLNGFLGITFS